MMSVCFRLDDPSPASDVATERSILEAFARRRIPLCVAAIPFGSAADGARIMLSRQNAGHLVEASRDGAIEIAQHGHMHARIGTPIGRAPSEFCGIPFAEQQRLIAEGNAHLEALFGCRIRGFVPPWNTYDRATLRAVALAGLGFLSAGPEVIKASPLPVVPATCTLRDARRTLEGAWHYRALAPLLVVAFHPDDFKEFRLQPLPDEQPAFTSLAELEALLDWVKAADWIRTEALADVAESVRGGALLCDPQGLTLPYRVRARVPPILTRAGEWTTVPGVLWGAARSQWRPLSAVQ
jgi:hypothetical protein